MSTEVGLDLQDRRERSLRPLRTGDAVPVGSGPSPELGVLLERSRVENVVRDLVRELMVRPPRETIGGARRANTGYVASAKVGRLIPFNSRNYEYPAILKLEYDARCICYFPQPGPFTIERRQADGTVKKTTYRPDFVAFYRIIGSDDTARIRIVFIQCKSEDELQGHPDRFVWADGRWHDYDAERALSDQLGASHEIWTTPDFNETLIANLRVLRPKLASTGYVPDEIRFKVVQMLRRFPGETLTGLRRRLPDVGPDHVHELIVAGVIAARLDRDRLDFPDQVRLFACAAIALALDFPATVEPARATTEVIFKIGLDVRWYGRDYRIANLATTANGQRQVLLSVQPEGSTIWVKQDELVKDAQARQFVVMAKPEDNAMRFLASAETDAEKAQLAKNLTIAHRLRGGATPITRQERRIAAKMRDAAAAGKALAEELTPKLSLRGWFGPRMPDADPTLKDENLELLKAQIAAYASDDAAGTIASHYQRYAEAAEAIGCIPVSDETFRKRVKELPTKSTTENREGHRAANAVAASRRSHSIIAVKGPRAHGDTLVDHTKLAVMMVAIRGARVYEIGRGWLTLAVCSFSTRVMKHVLLCDEPSQATLQLLARGYVDLYQRLPDAWGHDNGREFGSYFWVAMNGDRGVDIHSHPVADSRFGSEVELTFGAMDRRLWDNILGGTKAVAHRRRLTRDFDPQRKTPWTLADVDQLVSEWIEAHNNTPLAGIERTPNELYEESLSQVGTAPEREITPGRDWDWFSFVRPDRTGLFQVRRGEVRIKGIPYTSRELAELPDKAQVEGRYDPFDRSRAMAKVGEVPVYLSAGERYDFLRQVSERDRRYASQEATKVLGRGAKSHEHARFMRQVIERQESLRAIRSGDQRMLLDANGQFMYLEERSVEATLVSESHSDIRLADVKRERAEVAA